MITIMMITVMMMIIMIIMVVMSSQEPSTAYTSPELLSNLAYYGPALQQIVVAGRRGRERHCRFDSECTFAARCGWLGFAWVLCVGLTLSIHNHDGGDQPNALTIGRVSRF
jgi:hypothetical protein